MSLVFPSSMDKIVVSALRYVPKPGYGFAPTPRSHTFTVGVIYNFIEFSPIQEENKIVCLFGSSSYLTYIDFINSIFWI